MSREIDATVRKLNMMSLEQLRAEWQRRLKRPVPPCRSRDLLRGVLAWSMQEQAYGGLRPETRRQLRDLGSSGKAKQSGTAPRRLMPGTLLLREWRGVSYRVYVQEDGYAYEGRQFADLSSIARLITGTRWSGPRFFGLRQAKP